MFLGKGIRGIRRDVKPVGTKTSVTRKGIESGRRIRKLLAIAGSSSYTSDSRNHE